MGARRRRRRTRSRRTSCDEGPGNGWQAQARGAGARCASRRASRAPRWRGSCRPRSRGAPKDGASTLPVDRLPAGEAVVEAVPPLDGVLPGAPAKEDVLALAQRREVDETDVDVLHLDAELGQPLDAVLQLGGGGCELLASRLADAVAAAVPRDELHELALLAFELAQSRAHGDHPLDERPHLGEGAVSLGRSEHSGHGGSGSY